VTVTAQDSKLLKFFAGFAGTEVLTRDGTFERRWRGYPELTLRLVRRG